MKLTRQHRALLTIVMRHPDSAHLLRRMAVVQRLTNGRGDYSIKELADYFHISKATMRKSAVSESSRDGISSQHRFTKRNELNAAGVDEHDNQPSAARSACSAARSKPFGAGLLPSVQLESKIA